MGAEHSTVRLVSHGQSHLGQHLSPFTSMAKPSRPQLGGSGAKGQLWDLLKSTSWLLTQMYLVHSSTISAYGGLVGGG